MPQQSLEELDNKYTNALKQIHEFSVDTNNSDARNASNLQNNKLNATNKNSELLPIDKSVIEAIVDDIEQCSGQSKGGSGECVCIQVMMNFNEGGKLLWNDFQLVKSGITNVLKSNMVFQAIKRAAFLCESEGYNLLWKHYDRGQSLRVKFESNRYNA